MTDNSDRQRPVRKLTVKNFSVIRDAETIPLEFGKFTVLTGPQASGKSLLCKLAYFLEKRVIDFAAASLLRAEPVPFERFRDGIPRELLTRFPLATWKNPYAEVSFESGDYAVRITIDRGQANIEFTVDFSDPFRAAYNQIVQALGSFKFADATSRQSLDTQVRARLNLLQHEGFVDDAVYIPATRALFANSALSASALANSNLETFTREFAYEVDLGGSWNPNPLAGERVMRSIDKIRDSLISILGGAVVGHDSSLRFERSADGLSFPLEYASSGTQELIPLADVIRQLSTRQRDRVIFPRKDNISGMPETIVVSRPRVYLEEPESNVFPATQKDLVQLFAFLGNAERLEFSWVISTHSPYLITAFNLLLQAWRAGNKPGKYHEVDALIPEQYWIGENDFRAYAMHDGVLRSIFEAERENAEGSGLIDGDYLDSVSDQLGGEFDKILDIEYAE